MSLKRVKAILLEEFYITRASMEVIVDLFFLSLMSVVVFGFFSLFLSSRSKARRSTTCCSACCCGRSCA